MEAGVTTDRVEQVIFDGLAEVGAERDQISREATFDSLEVAPWPDYTSGDEEPSPTVMPPIWSRYSSEGAGSTR